MLNKIKKVYKNIGYNLFNKIKYKTINNCSTQFLWQEVKCIET
jgi:hypothetical protein